MHVIPPLDNKSSGICPKDSSLAVKISSFMRNSVF